METGNPLWRPLTREAKRRRRRDMMGLTCTYITYGVTLERKGDECLISESVRHSDQETTVVCGTDGAL